MSDVDLPFSVLMSVYQKETAENLSAALKSVMCQSLMPSEVVIVEDGPLTESLYSVLATFKDGVDSLNVRIVRLDDNLGLGLALRAGMEVCEYDLIARMDSDDIADKERFESQIGCFRNNPELSIVGSNVTEFLDHPSHIISERVMPEKHEEIVSFSRRRNPFAHPSVVLRKSVAIVAGGYQDKKLCEDYDLWTRMIKSGAKCYNVQRYLLSMRTSVDFYERRGGLGYVLSVLRFKSGLLRSGYMSFVDFAFSAGSSTVIGLAPARLRVQFYKRALRKRI